MSCITNIFKRKDDFYNYIFLLGIKRMLIEYCNFRHNNNNGMNIIRISMILLKNVRLVTQYRYY